MCSNHTTQTKHKYIEKVGDLMIVSEAANENRFTYHINEKALEMYLKGYAYEKDSMYWNVASTNPNRVC